MILKVDIDSSALYARMKDGARRFAFDVEQGLRETALLVQKDVRAHARTVMTIRKEDFFMREVAKVIFPSVRQGRAWTEVYVGQKSRLLLSEYEAGGPRLPFKGRRVAVPRTGSLARPTFQSSVPEEFTIQGLGIVRGAAAAKKKQGITRSRRARANVRFGAHRTIMGKIQYKGAHRTFMTDTGIFQRVGTCPDDIRMLYSLKDHVEVDPHAAHRLGFEAIGWAHRDTFADRLELATLKSIAKSGGLN